MTTTHTLRNTLSVAALVMAVLLPFAVRADEAAEVSTAATHAGMAANAPNLTQAQMHLHHALNCLVGPAGKDFDASNANPCKAQGNGAIPDSTDAAKKQTLQHAARAANDALKDTDLDAIKKDAASVAASLKGAQ